MFPHSHFTTTITMAMDGRVFLVLLVAFVSVQGGILKQLQTKNDFKKIRNMIIQSSKSGTAQFDQVSAF